MARLGCIARINGHHRHAREGGLVSDELLQLVESPRVEATALTLALAGRLADTRLADTRLADTRQVLQHNGLPLRLRLCYDVLANFVVNVLLETPLFAAKRGKETAAVAPRRSARSLSGLRLKRPAHPVTLLAVGIQLASSVIRAVRQRTDGVDADGVDADIVDAAIYPERIGRLMFFGKVGLDLNVDVVRSALLAQDRTGRLLTRKLFTRVLHAATLQCRDQSARGSSEASS